MLLPEQTTCLYCNKTIDKYNKSLIKGKYYYDKRRIKKFCNQNCFKLYHNKTIHLNAKIEYTCLYCKTQFIDYAYKKRKFCSNYCNGKFNQSCKRVKSWIFKKVKPKIIKLKRNKINKKYCKCCTKQCYTSRLICKNCKSYHIKSYKLKIIYYCRYCNKNTLRNFDICGKCQEHNRSKFRYKIKKQQAYIIKQNLINKAGGCCQLCGYNQNNAALCFHHKDPKTKLHTIDISTIFKYLTKLDIIYTELEKCILLCSNCHAITHEKLRKTNNKGYIKRKQLIEYKGGKCEKCNLQSEYAQVYNFHHIDIKNFALDAIQCKNKSMIELQQEADNCQLLCFNCHLDLHHPQCAYICKN